MQELIIRFRSNDRKRMVEGFLVDEHTERYDIYQWRSTENAGDYVLINTIETPALEGDFDYKASRIAWRARLLAKGGEI